MAGTTRDILNAVSFPRFVTELINGVFKAMVDSNRQQMQGYVELLNNVSASTEGFADSNMGADRARQWLAERYPGTFVVEGDSEEDRWEGEPKEAAETTLRLRPGATPPSAEALRTDLGLAPGESVPTGDPERTLVPLARRALARQRQQMLATMVMLGMQRIVIDSGRISASMRFHIDTRSAAQDDQASQFDFRNTINAAGNVGIGIWGASASMTNTIGYVSTQKTQTTEEMNTDLDLNSSVELVFKTDYLPLERMAGQGQIDRIKVNTLNPEAEAKAAAEARGAREKRISETDAARRASLDKTIGAPPPTPPPPAAGADGSPEKAKANQERAAQEKKSTTAQQPAGAKKPAATPAPTPTPTPAPTPTPSPPTQRHRPIQRPPKRRSVFRPPHPTPRQPRGLRASPTSSSTRRRRKGWMKCSRLQTSARTTSFTTSAAATAASSSPRHSSTAAAAWASISIRNACQKRGVPCNRAPSATSSASSCATSSPSILRTPTWSSLTCCPN